ncbi:MAG: UDP-N-acetylmuramoyl-L-alanyl-D-glutamate--2,6-diaminopimelate ligase [Candidatus Omnitrophota bacterium]|nr:UDP-N-acetylmuramoyl-L-alanyl-D-glutamate--2,6-diaminopimelate ligase [Candidatus Omnitrophota bacterium]
MKQVKLKTLLSGLDYRLENSLVEVDIRGLSSDSRAVRKGYLFVAITGSKLDGHKFVKQAVKKGASAVILQQDLALEKEIVKILVPDTKKVLAKLASRFYEYPSSRVKVIGITGTNGKTTTSYLLNNILLKKGLSSGLVGTINYCYKDKVIPAGLTTPGSIELQSLLGKMAFDNVDYSVIEVSSHSLSQHRIDYIDFDTGIFTNLTRDHLDYHQTMDNYFEAKARFFESLSSRSKAVINIDDPYGRKLINRTKASVLTYGIDNPADITGQIKNISINGTTFDLKTPNGKLTVEMKLIGKFNVYNALAAVGAGLSVKMDLAGIAAGLRDFNGVKGRLEKIEAGQNFKVFIDYAHTDNALENLLCTLGNLKEAKIITVFGCGGQRDVSKRPLMGKVAQQFSDYVILTSDNPRSENPLEIINQIKSGMDSRKNNYQSVPERYQAIKQALIRAGENDIVVIAGKGHESYQVIGNEKIAFDDSKAVKEILSECLPAKRS